MIKKPCENDFTRLIFDAEEEGFEPPVRFRTPVFKTGALNRALPLFLSRIIFSAAKVKECTL